MNGIARLLFEAPHQVKFAAVKARGKLFNRICVPIAPDKQNPAFPVQRRKEAVNHAGDLPCRNLILNGHGGGYAVRQLVQRDIVNAVSFLRGLFVVLLEGKVPHNAANVA